MAGFLAAASGGELVIRGRLLLRSGRARRIADATDRLREDIA